MESSALPAKHDYNPDDISSSSAQPPPNPFRLTPDPEDPPIYAEENDGTNIETIIAQLLSSSSDGPSILPIRTHPWNVVENVDGNDEAEALQTSIIDQYFNAIKKKGDEVVALLISSNIVTADTTNELGETPLLTAVAAGNVRMVQELMDFGANVNMFGAVPDLKKTQLSFRMRSIYRHGIAKSSQKGLRTPLQLAATLGNLNLVKLFVEVYHANDALIAPDGQLALRLAVEKGHADIVAYLPARRGGGWRRWKIQHGKALRRVKHATHAVYCFFEFFLWTVPKFFAWDTPKYTWKSRNRIAKWAKKQAQKGWKNLAKAPKYLGKACLAVPGAIWLTIKAIWRVILGIPGALKAIAKWIWKGIANFGKAIFSVLKRSASFIHTLFSSLMSFLKAVTVKDVMNSFVDLLRAVFIGFPQALWKFIKSFGTMTYKVMKSLFGLLGQIVWWIVWGLLAIVVYVPRKTLQYLGTTGGTAVKEILVWFNPKRGVANAEPAEAERDYSGYI
jgi:hypothetical protein